MYLYGEKNCSPSSIKKKLVSFKLLRQILALSFLDPTAESPCEDPSHLLRSSYICSHGLKCVSRQSVDTHRETENENLCSTLKLQNVRTNKTQSLCETPSPLLQSSYICSHGHNCVSRQSVETHRETDNENLSATVQKQLTKHPHASEKPQAIKTALCICWLIIAMFGWELLSYR